MNDFSVSFNSKMRQFVEGKIEKIACLIIGAALALLRFRGRRVAAQSFSRLHPLAVKQ